MIENLPLVFGYKYLKKRFMIDPINYNFEVLQNRAKKCAFIVQTRTEEEWSSFTKRLNIWKAKESEIFKHERKMAELHWDDFNDADIN